MWTSRIDISDIRSLFLVRFCRDTPSSWMMLGSDNVAPVAARGWSVRNPMIGLINICCDLVPPRKDTRYDDIRYCDPGRKDNGKPEFANILRRWLVVVPCLCLSCWVSLQPSWTTFPWCRTAVLAKVLCSQKIHSSHFIWASPRMVFRDEILEKSNALRSPWCSQAGPIYRKQASIEMFHEPMDSPLWQLVALGAGTGACFECQWVRPK